MDTGLLLTLLFALGFIIGFSLTSWRLKNKIQDVLTDLKIHYKVLDEEQYNHFMNKYGGNKDSWIEKGMKKVSERKKGKDLSG